MNGNWIGDYAFFRARIDSTKEVVIDVDGKKGYTYKALDERANRLAHALKEHFHVEKGDRVAFLSRNRIELIDAYFATGKTGTIFVPYNARLSAEELNQLILKEKPTVLFCEDLFLDKADYVKENSALKHVVILSNEKDYPDDYEALVAAMPKTSVSCDNDLEDIHMIIHTGGTTGLPKGGLVSYKTELFNSFNEICTWGLNHEVRTLLLLPLFHTGGWNLLTLPLLHVGGTLFINRQFDPALTLELVEKERLTCLFGAATIFRMMVEVPEFYERDLSSLQWMMAGAAPTPLNIMEIFWNRGIKFVLGYGMTEAGPNNLSSPPQFMSDQLMRDKYASVGKPMYLSLVKIIDDEGNEILEPHTPGELIWSGPQIFSGYWDHEEATEETLINGWVYTGDMAVFDEEGFYYIVGRKKNMFISGGENVFPPEIEQALYSIPEIHECCVIAVSDEKWGEVGKAVYSFKPGMSLSKEEIKQSLSDQLAKYKVPKYYRVVDEVPKNNVGKIVVSEVEKQYGESED